MGGSKYVLFYATFNTKVRWLYVLQQGHMCGVDTVPLMSSTV